MKNILKTLVVLVSASLISLAAKAGELAVSGSANASYVISSGQTAVDKGLGISNELMFKASGELDNGFTWDYHTELDNADGGSTSNDDTALVIGMGGLGKIGIYDAEGGLSTETGYGIGALGVGQDFANTMTNIGIGSDVSADAHVAYYTPADLLPFGIEVAAGFAPNTGDGQSNSFKSSGGTNPNDTDGKQAAQYRVSATPISGLSIGADYYETQESQTALGQEKSAGTAYAKYAMGNFKFGLFQGYRENGVLNKAATAAADTATASNGDRYEYDGYGVEFAFNEALSLSFSTEKYERIDKTNDGTGASHTKAKVESDADYIQVAYNIGGATLGLAIADTDNSDYTADKKEKKTLFTMQMEF